MLYQLSCSPTLPSSVQRLYMCLPASPIQDDITRLTDRCTFNEFANTIEIAPLNMPTASSTPPEATGIKLLRTWGWCVKLPMGKWLFSRILGNAIPYTGSIKARVEHLEPGHAVVVLPDRRRVRNHLDSVHAIALANMAELSTGLAMISGLPAGINGILVGLNVSYAKKARGELRAECKCSIPASQERHEVAIDTEIKDQAGDIVTRATATWLIGPK